MGLFGKRHPTISNWKRFLRESSMQQLDDERISLDDKVQELRGFKRDIQHEKERRMAENPPEPTPLDQVITGSE